MWVLATTCNPQVRISPQFAHVSSPFDWLLRQCSAVAGIIPPSKPGVLLNVWPEPCSGVQVTMAPFQDVAERLQQDVPPPSELASLVCVLLESLPFLEGSGHLVIYSVCKSRRPVLESFCLRAPAALCDDGGSFNAALSSSARLSQTSQTMFRNRVSLSGYDLLLAPCMAMAMGLRGRKRLSEGGISPAFAFGTSVYVRFHCVMLHPCHAPPGARQGPRRLGCASSPPLELGRRPSRAGRLASGAVRARCGPLSFVPAQHGVRPSGCTHATPTSRPSGPWPLLAEPYYCGTGVAEKGSAEGALAAGPLGGPAFRLRACDADGLARFAWRHELTTRRVASYHWCLL